jgi:hypothetical protein
MLELGEVLDGLQRALQPVKPSARTIDSTSFLIGYARGDSISPCSLLWSPQRGA